MRASTRSNLLRLFIVAIFGLLAALPAGIPAAAFGAQDASPPATPADLPPLLVEWAAAWEAGDPDRLVALYTADAVYEEVPTASVARGHEEIRAFYAATHANFADIRVTPVRGFREGDHAVLEGLFAGSANGQPFEVPFVAILDLDGDLIRHSRDYFDLYSVLDQIGALPGPETPEAATPAA
jgi:steroid delta-isomerase-like uncharacterized protein